MSVLCLLITGLTRDLPWHVLLGVFCLSDEEHRCWKCHYEVMVEFWDAGVAILCFIFNIIWLSHHISTFWHPHFHVLWPNQQSVNVMRCPMWMVDMMMYVARRGAWTWICSKTNGGFELRCDDVSIRSLHLCRSRVKRTLLLFNFTGFVVNLQHFVL